MSIEHHCFESSVDPIRYGVFPDWITTRLMACQPHKIQQPFQYLSLLLHNLCQKPVANSLETRSQGRGSTHSQRNA